MEQNQDLPILLDKLSSAIISACERNAYMPSEYRKQIVSRLVADQLPLVDLRETILQLTEMLNEAQPPEILRARHKLLNISAALM